MDDSQLPDNPYLLLTPGPLSTTKTVKAVMLRDWCTWDDDYNDLVQDIRRRLVRLAAKTDDYTAVLMQGSGTFAMESVIGTAMPENGRLLVLVNGAYGRRIVEIALRLGISVSSIDSGELGPLDIGALSEALESDPSITHVAVVHCETTTGMLNCIDAVGHLVKAHGRTFIVDAMSSFGGIPLDMAELGIDFLISSANKCIQGVPGFGFAVARRSEMEKLKGRARSLSLDLYDQWQTMEEKKGKWRYTSPTHTVRAFAQALEELETEGGVAARHRRYVENHQVLVRGMRHLGFRTVLSNELQSPFITSFFNPDHPDFEFSRFYSELRSRGFVIYPGKVTSVDSFRIGHIGHVFPKDMESLIVAVKQSMYWKE